MDNIEQLKQDNEKLKERLNNAAKFFRDQKTQIEALTNEVKEKTSLAMDYRNQIEDLTKENKELKDNQNIVDPNTITELNERVKELEKTIKSKDQAYQLLQDTYNEVFADYNKLKEANTGLIEENKKLTSLGIDYVNQINDYKKSVDHLQNTLKSVEENKAEYEKQINTYKKSLDDINLDHNKLKKEHDTLNKTYNKLNNEYSDVYTKYNDLQQEQIKTNEKLNALNTLCIQFKEDNKALQDKYDNLEKICNDFENQKLAADADYQGILDMYQELQKEYERLRNERDAYSQSDDALAEIAKILIEKGFVNKNDLTPQTGIKESGTAHRMGDNLESGKNVGV